MNGTIGRRAFGAMAIAAGAGLCGKAQAGAGYEASVAIEMSHGPAGARRLERGNIPLGPRARKVGWTRNLESWEDGPNSEALSIVSGTIASVRLDGESRGILKVSAFVVVQETAGEGLDGFDHFKLPNGVTVPQINLNSRVWNVGGDVVPGIPREFHLERKASGAAR